MQPEGGISNLKRETRPLAIFVLASILALIASAAYGSTTGIISGVVTDAASGAKLSGVNVVVKGTGLTTVTDGNGYFVVTNVPPGAYEVSASMVGYGDGSKTDIQVQMDATSAADVSLKKTEIAEGDVTVKATKKKLIQPDMAPTLYMVPSKQEKMVKGQPNNLYQLPGIVGTQPGVVLDPDGKPHIRGGRGDEIGYMVEGIPVTEPQTNVFGTNMVTVGMSKMQLYTGGYRAEYGNAISGVLNEIKKTGSESPGGSMDMTGGTQSYGGTYLEYGGTGESGLDYYVGSYLWKSTFQRLFVQGGESADTVGKFVYTIGKKDKYTLLLNQGSARYYLGSEHDFTYLHAPTQLEKDHNHQGYDIFGLTWSHTFSPSSFLTVRPYNYRTKTITDALAPDGPVGMYLASGSTQRGLQTEYTNQISQRHLMKAGASLTQSSNHYLAWVPDLGTAFGFPEWGDYSYTSRVNTLQTGAFIQDQAKLGRRWRAEAGLRYDQMNFDRREHSDLSESQTSPRLGLTYTLDNRNLLKFSWGRFVQFPPSYVLEKKYDNAGWINYRPESNDLRPERSTSWDFSWERQLSTDMLLRVTPFYRKYTDLLQSQPLDPNNPESMTSIYINSGQGQSKGVETYLSKKLSHNWEGWLSYTWMKARANASDFSSSIDPSVWAYVDWDQRHTLSAVLSYNQKSWRHDIQLSYGSGLADVVDVSTAGLQKHGQGALVVSWNITKKLPAADSKVGDSLYLNIYNLFNTGGTNRYRYDYYGNRVQDAWTTPRFITTGITRKF
jgi:outer membrane receptor protein involved in Fe transport